MNMIAKALGVLMGSALVACVTSESGEGAAEAASTCSPAEAIALGAETKSTESTSGGGTVFNGLSLNGERTQGVELNGLVFQGISLNGLSLNGIRLNGLSLNGAAIQGLQLNGTDMQGIALNGAELSGELSDGTKLPVFIERVHENPDAANADVPLYEVSYGEKHQPLCGVGPDGAPKLAAALANTWDGRTGARIAASDRFTFACQGAALFKCVAAGYKPWLSAEAADLHQACTRMIRADYCGDGTSFTKDGTLIDMNDAAGIQKFETMSRPDFAFEAAWGPNGATCVSKTRYPLTAIPQCLRDRLADTCDGSVGLTNRSSTNNRCLR